MPWVRFDDQYPINRKVDSLSDPAFRLNTEAIFWCARNLTDGAVPEEDLDSAAPRKMKRPDKFVPELVARGLWHETGTQCDSEQCPANPDNAVSNGVTDSATDSVTAGWVIHDYFDYQPSKARVLEDRQSNAVRQKKWRDQQKQRTVTRKEGRNSVSNAVSNAASNAAPSRPVPSRRDGGSVGESSSGSRRTRETDDDPTTRTTQEQTIDRLIVGTLQDITGRTVPDDHATRVRRQLLDGRQVANPMAYVAKAIRERPNDFLPADLPPPIRDEPWMDVPPLGERDNGEVNSRGRAAVEAAIAAAKAAKHTGPEG